MNDKQQLAAMGEHMREMEESEPRITKDARIGGVVFKAGVKVSTVIEAAYRAAEFHKPNQKAFDSLVDAISRKSTNDYFKVPDGWMLVPEGGTESIIDDAIDAGRFDEDDAVYFWASMLAAAPEYKP